MYSGVLVILFKDVFLPIGIVAAMLQLNRNLTLLSFSVVPIVVVTFSTGPGPAGILSGCGPNRPD